MGLFPRTPDEWFYDDMLKLWTKKEYEAKIREAKIQKFCRENFRNVPTKKYTFRMVENGKTLERTYNIPPELEELFSATAVSEIQNEGVRYVSRQARPILVGPATLEMLLEKQDNPKMDYIKRGNLPFNPLYFEIQDGPKFTIPHFQKTAKLRGSQLKATKGSENDQYSYFMNFFFEADREIYSLFLNPRTNTQITVGQIDRVSDLDVILDKNPEIQRGCDFYIDLGSKKTWLSTTREKRAMFVNWMGYNPTQEPDFDAVFDEVVDYETTDKNSLAEVLPRLTFNLINYINGHNVHFAPHQRTYQTLEPQEKGGWKKRTVTRPFSIVLIKDEDRRTSEAIGPTGQKLEHRLFVRGHDRKYRTETGEIKQIIWISPHIKGPQDAPFYDQRHAVSAEKLLRERDLYASFKTQQ